MADDYLKLLRLGPGATADDIKKSYRKLAKEHHPDRFKDGKDKKKQQAVMARLNEAYHKALEGLKDAVQEPAEDGEVTAPDYALYKKGVASFNRYNGSISLKFKNNRLDQSVLLGKKNGLVEAKALFERLLREYPDSDWCFDAEERLAKIGKALPLLEKTIGESGGATLAWTKKGTPYWKKNG